MPNHVKKTALASLAICVLGACSSAPKPAQADGSVRVAANDPQRLEAHQARVAADRALLTENNLLRAQVAVLTVKNNELTTIVREALVLPPAAPSPTAATPLALAPGQTNASSSRLVIDLPALPPQAYTTNAQGVVIRVFHPFARTEFQPSPEVAQALRAGIKGADSIEVRGHTDSAVDTPIDKLIAIERAEKARTWLINTGGDAAKIRTRHFVSGHFLNENRTAQERSVNRRVEIDINNPQLAGTRSASAH